MMDFKIDGDLSDIGQAVSNKFLYERGYRLAHTGRSIKDDQFAAFIAALQLDGYTVGDLTEFDGTITAYSGDQTIFVRASTQSNTDIYTNQDNSLGIVAFFNAFKQFFDMNEDSSEMVRVEYYYHHEGQGSRSTTIRIEKKQITKTYPELYPDYDVAELVRQYIASPESILLLYGPPGVGKTQFILYILSQGSFGDIVYVKDQKVLQASDFWAEMSQRNTELMIFDDMDEGLQPRKNKKGTDFTSNLLSFSNGVFDKSTKIIITTNQPIEEIDAALVRPGRCFDFLTLHPLGYAEARAIWVGVLKRPEADFERLYAGQNYVTQASLMSDYNRERHSFTERSYVKHGNRNYNVQSKLQANGVSIK